MGRKPDQDRIGLESLWELQGRRLFHLWRGSVAACDKVHRTGSASAAQRESELGNRLGADPPMSEKVKCAAGAKLAVSRRTLE